MPRKTTPRVSEATRDFIAQRFARSGSATQRYCFRSLLKRFEAAVNDCQLGSITPGHVEDFFYGPDGVVHACQPSTLGRYRNDLKSFFAWCHRRGYIAVHADIMVGGIAEKSTRSRRKRLRLTAGELLRLIDGATDPRDHALLVFVANTACRISEALAMTVGDVNLDRGEIDVDIIKTKDRDIMPITAELDAELRSWLMEYGRDQGGLQSHYRLFPARIHNTFKRCGKIYNPHARINNPGLIIRQVARQAGVQLGTGDGWHMVRRSIARIYFDNASSKGHDAALRETAALLHHKNTSTTEIYLGLELEKMRRDVVMRGQPFLTRLADEDNVVPLRRATGE